MAKPTEVDTKKSIDIMDLQKRMSAAKTVTPSLKEKELVIPPFLLEASKKNNLKQS